MGDLDVIAEDLVEADLEAGDPCPANLLGLVFGDPGLASLRGGSQLVAYVNFQARVLAGLRVLGAKP